MKNETLEKTIQYLLEIEPNESPLISCFVCGTQPHSKLYDQVREQAMLAGKRLLPKLRADYEDARAEVESYIRSMDGTRKSMAIFARWGDEPVFVPLEFDVPMDASFIVDTIPHIYPLIELKDTYQRFVIAITTEQEGRILEMSVGSVTESMIMQRPDLRTRIGREWTQEKYRKHKKEKEQLFVREKVKVIDELMSQRGHNHLVIAGSPKMAARLRDALPERLKKRLVQTLDINPSNGVNPILLEAISAIVDTENLESMDHVQQLQAAVLRDGLGVAGYDAAKAAIEGHYASLVVIDQDHDDETREEIIRLAAAADLPIETVHDSAALDRLGGVGCLLRYRPAYAPTAAVTPSVAKKRLMEQVPS